jgi:hypothetical protein
LNCFSTPFPRITRDLLEIVSGAVDLQTDEKQLRTFAEKQQNVLFQKVLSLVDQHIISATVISTCKAGFLLQDF